MLSKAQIRRVSRQLHNCHGGTWRKVMSCSWRPFVASATWRRGMTIIDYSEGAVRVRTKSRVAYRGPHAPAKKNMEPYTFSWARKKSHACIIRQMRKYTHGKD